MTERQAKLFAFRAGIAAIRAARSLEDVNAKRAQVYYRAAWDFFEAWCSP